MLLFLLFSMDFEDEIAEKLTQCQVTPYIWLSAFRALMGHYQIAAVDHSMDGCGCCFDVLMKAGQGVYGIIPIVEEMGYLPMVRKALGGRKLFVLPLGSGENLRVYPTLIH